MNGAYSRSPVLRRPEYLTNTTSARLFNHSYPPKSTPITGFESSYPYTANQQYYQPSCQPTYPAAYPTSYRPDYQPCISSFNYSLPPTQLLSNGLPIPSTTLNYYQANPPTVINSSLLSGSEISISSKGLETILIAILILVALDLVAIRPHRPTLKQ